MHADLKARALEELRLYWIYTIYLFIVFGSLVLYRKLILAEAGMAYLHYGMAAIQAMVIAKVILIGRALKIGGRFEGKPLAISVAYKSITFGMVVLAFGVLEHIVTGLFERKSWADIGQHLIEVGIDELLARILMMMVAFVPLFAISELGRVIGTAELKSLFFDRGGVGRWTRAA